MESRDVMLSESQMLEAFFELRRIDEEIGDDDNESALPHGFREFIEDFRETRFPLGFGFLERIEKQFQVGGGSFGGDVLNNLFRDGRDPNRIALLCREVGERRTNTPPVIDFGQHSFRRKPHGSAGVEDSTAAEVGVGLELFDVVPVGTAERAPIESAQIVAGDVLSVLGELDAGTAMRRSMLA